MTTSVPNCTEMMLPPTPSFADDYWYAKNIISPNKKTPLSNPPKHPKRTHVVAFRRLRARIQTLVANHGISLEEPCEIVGPNEGPCLSQGQVYGVTWQTFIGLNLDFRKSAGKQFREKHNIAHTRAVRKLQKLLLEIREVSISIRGRPPLSNLPTAIREQTNRIGLGGWVRHLQRVQGAAILSPHLWHSDCDVFSCEPFSEIPRQFIVVCKNVHKRQHPPRAVSGSAVKAIWPTPQPSADTAFLQTLRKVEASYAQYTTHWYAFDIRGLLEHIRCAVEKTAGTFSGKDVKNPYTNQYFDPLFLVMVLKRGKQLTQSGLLSMKKGSLPGQHTTMNGNTHNQATTALPQSQAAPPLSEAQMEQGLHPLRLQVLEGFTTLSYTVTYDMLAGLTHEQMASWYHECRDIWSFRAELTSATRRQIVPGATTTTPLFAHYRTMNPDHWRQNHSAVFVQYHALTEMLRLITSAPRLHDRETGANYVLAALVLCSRVFQDAFPMLYYAVQV
jgi:hypothetical protein